MNKKVLPITLALALAFTVLGCQKKEVAPPPPPPPPPPVVEKKPEAVKVDSSAIWARQRAEKITQAKSSIEAKKIFFDFDKSNIKPEFVAPLNDVSGVMKEFSDVSIRIEGNCDERGTTAYNLALGERRANSARQFLIDGGVSASRIETKSWGKEKPVALGHDEESWKQNRRDDFFIVK